MTMTLRGYFTCDQAGCPNLTDCEGVPGTPVINLPDGWTRVTQDRTGRNVVQLFLCPACSSALGKQLGLSESAGISPPQLPSGNGMMTTPKP